MADYIIITDEEINAESPVTTVLEHKMRDNPIAIAEGSPGAPQIHYSAMKIEAGDIQNIYPEPEMQFNGGGSYEKINSGIVCGGITGTIRIKFAIRMNTAGTTYAQLYFDGAPIGPEIIHPITTKEYYSYDYTLISAGLIELYAYNVGSNLAYVGELSVYSNAPFQFSEMNIDSGL